MHPSIRLLSPLAVSLLLAACGGDDSPSTTSLTIPFAAKSGNTPIACDTVLPVLGTSGDSGKVSDFAFYVHDIQLKTSDGKSHTVTLEANDFQDPANGVALLDFQNKGDSCQGAAKPTNQQVYLNVSGVDTTKINGIAFKVGVPAAVNHHDASTSKSPYNRSGLFWSWQSGHKFMRLDINPTQKVQLAYDLNGVTESKTFFFHLGSTGCAGDPTTGAVVSCSGNNRPQVTLAENFSITGMTSSTVLLDYAQLMDGVNLNTDSVVPPGCMSGANDVECGTIFTNMGMGHAGTAASAAQKVFSVTN